MSASRRTLSTVESTPGLTGSEEGPPTGPSQNMESDKHGTLVHPPRKVPVKVLNFAKLPRDAQRDEGEGPMTELSRALQDSPTLGAIAGSHGLDYQERAKCANREG